MRNRLSVRLVPAATLGTAISLALLCQTRAASVELKTNSWAHSREGFAAFARRVESNELRNLLARKGVTVTSQRAGSLPMLTDSHAGTMGEEGRVFLDGKPSIITYYLGGPKTVTEIGVLGFNCDARANQDYEVYVADNSAHPGKAPDFDKALRLTTGETIIGANRGGFHSAFACADGSPLTDGTIDWVQFRIWPTYNVQAGQPGKDKTAAGSATVIVELEVLGTVDDVIVLSPEVLARRKALREAPRKHPYEKRTSWLETLLATREAIVEWENKLDALMVPEMGVSLGGWYTAGPFNAGAPEINHLTHQRTHILTNAVTFTVGKEKRTIQWQPRPDIRDGHPADVAAGHHARPGQTLFLCRDLVADNGFDRNAPLSLGIGGIGTTRLLPNGHTTRLTDMIATPGPNQRLYDITAQGNHQVLVALTVGSDGRCPFWFMPHAPLSSPGAGTTSQRVNRRERVIDQVMRDFPASVATLQMTWERADSIWTLFKRHQMARIEKFITDWPTGNPAFLAGQYHHAATTRLDAVESTLPEAPARLSQVITPWLKAQRAAPVPADTAAARAAYYRVAAVQEALADANRITALRLAIQDQAHTFGKRYPQAKARLAQAAALESEMNALAAKIIGGTDSALETLLALRANITRTSRDILLANPLLAPDVLPALLLTRGGPGFASNWGGPNRLGNEIVKLAPVRPNGEITTVHRGTVSDMHLSFDAKHILFSDGRYVQEVNIDGSGHRRLSSQTDEHVHHYDVCRLPNGKIMFVSTACEQAVPCTGGWHVGNLHVMDDDGTNERRLTYDQDHNWNPWVMNNGRVIYTRWEYTDTPHYFTRLLCSMNPDGSNQAEFYGSNSYWPNAMYWPRPIPGHASRIVCIVSGHHGVSRMGELVVLDPALGRHEADGVVQRIPGRGRKVEPVIKDGLVGDSWPRFATPYPLAMPGTHEGAGTYFLVSCKMTPYSNWGLYLVDTFDNMTCLLEGGYAMPTPLRPRPTPPDVAPRVDLTRGDAVVNMIDVYTGGGLAGYPRGSIKALRLGTHEYRFGGNGDTRASSLDGGWDIKRILGTVPVHEDGSALFRVPANTPIFVQPLDAEGKAQQVMRSWFVAMPGEIVSCVGCHEKQNNLPPAQATALMANQLEPAEITPWHGPERGFSFDRELQPVLDHRCVGCHAEKPGRPDFRAKSSYPDYKGPYSPAYLALHPFVRRAGFEADYHLAVPAEWQADTSHLVQLLKKGHHNVTLSREEWERLYTWIDFNVPYPANWTESHRPPDPAQVARRTRYKKLYANVNDQDEVVPPLPEPVAFAAPAPLPEPPPAASLTGWPPAPEQAAQQQKDTGRTPLALDLGDGITMAFQPIPAGSFVMGQRTGFPDEAAEAVVTIDSPFYLATCEVSNEQYAQFDRNHDSAYIDARGKDRFTRGYPVNAPAQPVVRVNWHEAMAFCRWLSKRSGHTCSLPTEAEWEYACRAGTATPWYFGDTTERLPRVANVNDNSLRGWNWGRCENGYSDGQRYASVVGTFPPNAWGLRDMLGNVAEWTQSTFAPYPYVPGDGRNKPDNTGTKVVRGGSWNDTFHFARSASRWRYVPHQPVYNVGFRVLCRPVEVAQR